MTAGAEAAREEWRQRLPQQLHAILLVRGPDRRPGVCFRDVLGCLVDRSSPGVPSQPVLPPIGKDRDSCIYDSWSIEVVTKR